MSIIILISLGVLLGRNYEAITKQIEKDTAAVCKSFGKGKGYRKTVRMVFRILTLLDKYLDGRKAKVNKKPTHDMFCSCSKCQPSFSTYIKKLKRA